MDLPYWKTINSLILAGVQSINYRLHFNFPKIFEYRMEI